MRCTLTARYLEDKPENVGIDDQKRGIGDEYDREHKFVGDRVDDIDGRGCEETHAEHDNVKASRYVGVGNFIVVLANHALLL